MYIVEFVSHPEIWQYIDYVQMLHCNLTIIWWHSHSSWHLACCRHRKARKLHGAVRFPVDPRSRCFVYVRDLKLWFGQAFNCQEQILWCGSVQYTENSIYMGASTLFWYSHQVRSVPLQFFGALRYVFVRFVKALLLSVCCSVDLCTWTLRFGTVSGMLKSRLAAAILVGTNTFQRDLSSAP